VVEGMGLGISLDPSHAATYWGYREKPHVYYQAYLDPYTGAVLAVKNLDWDPLQLVRDFHQSLLLPYDIGHQIVGWSVVVFLAMLVTGFCLWWPRRSSRLHPGGLRAKFTIRWQSRFRRLNYDLHSVLGLYVLSLGLILAVTGLVWSFPWVNRAIYWAATGGGVKAAPVAPKSDRLAAAAPAGSARDRSGLRQGRPAPPRGGSVLHRALAGRDLRPHGMGGRGRKRERDRQLPLGRIPLRPLRRDASLD
jgi:uncharacterized iron-regulated membrane protein